MYAHFKLFKGEGAGLVSKDMTRHEMTLEQQSEVLSYRKQREISPCIIPANLIARPFGLI